MNKKINKQVNSEAMTLSVAKIMNTVFEKTILENFLAIQWLGLSVFTAMARVQYLLKELRYHKLQGVVPQKRKIN